MEPDLIVVGEKKKKVTLPKFMPALDEITPTNASKHKSVPLPHLSVI